MSTGIRRKINRKQSNSKFNRDQKFSKKINTIHGQRGGLRI